MAVRVDHKTGELKTRRTPDFGPEEAQRRLDGLDRRLGKGKGAASERAILKDVLRGKKNPPMRRKKTRRGGKKS
jgi:hypothetical protein